MKPFTIDILGFTYRATPKLSAYQDGSTALQLIDLESDTVLATISVWLPESGKLKPGEFYAKDWSENEGLIPQLLDAKLIEDIPAPPAAPGFIRKIFAYRICPNLLDAKLRFLPECSCPVCGYQMDAATNPNLSNPGQPEPGDLSLCTKCGEILAFNPDMTIRQALPDDLLTYPKRDLDTLSRLQRLVRKVRPIK